VKNITLVVPTFNSPEVVLNMLSSLRTNTDWEGRIIVVNNGGELPPLGEGVEVLQPGRNTGWMGAVNLGLEATSSELFCMANDDLLFVPGSWEFWSTLWSGFAAAPKVAGVAPTSNYVAGCQSAWWHTRGVHVEAPYLIGMLAMYDTGILKELGGLDEALPGGDDLDLSMRVQQSGRTLVCSRHAYVHHIGSLTGRREQPSHWDSRAHQTATQNALIQKYGLKAWHAMMTQPARVLR